ncbi:MAG: hypothetical protein J2P19_17145 [Pseudonocardia sp.]|nr:hypothetical protein [Pseudonocardia sp.]
MINCSAYLPDDAGGPGRLAEVGLDVLDIRPAELVLPEATVRDERGGRLLTDGLIVDPAGGGGPFAEAGLDHQARAFGLTNAAFHTQRALRYVTGLLGRPLPRLVVRIGMHERPRRWGGGHYRLPARDYDPEETEPIAPTGEVHLGGGRGLLPTPGARPYFAAPAHNMAIVYHEVGHHVCRHTADFRLNRPRPPNRQTNKKIALDEGCCDLLAAILLGTHDIYRWHRAALPPWDRRRRALGRQWTMAHFRGGRSDPHADGTVWASACWSARESVVAAGYDPARFDRMLWRGLELGGAAVAAELGGEVDAQALRLRRHVARQLEAMLRVDPDLADPVLAAMAQHGIWPGASNAELREADRAGRRAVVGA